MIPWAVWQKVPHVEARELETRRHMMDAPKARLLLRLENLILIVKYSLLRELPLSQGANFDDLLIHTLYVDKQLQDQSFT